MSHTTTYARLSSAEPSSETCWRGIAAEAHRVNGRAGDEAAARTHELFIHEIRAGVQPGSSTQIRYCPRCLARGRKYALLWGAPGPDWCGTCHWPRETHISTQM